MTLALSSASAAHAKDSLSFNLLSAQVATYSNSSPNSDSAAAKTQLASGGYSNSKVSAEASSHQDLPDLPLFELPPFQDSSSTPAFTDRSSNQSSNQSSDQSSDQSFENSDKQVSEDALSSSSNDLLHESSNSAPNPIPADRSPFAFPDNMTESELFESEPRSAQREETSIQKSEPRSAPFTPQLNEKPSSSAAGQPLMQSPHYSVDQSLELDFALPPSTSSKPSSTLSAPSAPSAPTPVASALPPTPAPIAEAPPKVDTDAIANSSLDTIFAGDSESLVAVAVGSAEGTRTPDGGRNSAYHGHVDPGNGVWNLGSFSYQHGADSPEQADAKQLARLRSQAETILQKAASKGIELTLEEKLNGIDLANQAPKAALDQQGYIDWLAEARKQGLTGSDAILWARVQSFIDPYTKTWDAPGLGNSEDRITHDQERRMLQIAKAIATYLQNVANQSPKTSDQQASQSSKAESQSLAQSFVQLLATLRFQYS
ncbi:MAG: hypothetical protein Kow00121_17000 [Elainellaceae cyanobacterium]